MGFKVKDTPERDNFKVEEEENKLRLYVLNQLSSLDIKTLQIAYVYAKNYVDYGADVTEKWVTACENSANLAKAYRKGCCEGYEKAKYDYCDKWRIKNFFGDGKTILDPEKPNFGLDAADLDLKACTDEKKEPQNPIYKFKIGQIVRKINDYPNHSTFKILDRFIINLTHPYYKIGLIDKFFNKDSQETVPNHYQYVPENRLILSVNTFKFNVGDIVRTKNANRGLYKISNRYCHNVKSNLYKIGPITDGYGCCTIVDEDQLELVQKRRLNE